MTVSTSRNGDRFSCNAMSLEYPHTQKHSVDKDRWEEFLAANPEVPFSIPGATRFPEK
jgi:hypothetical protein